MATRTSSSVPDQYLKRSELAQYLVMGASVRQHLPFNHKPSFTDLAASDPAYPFAEAAWRAVRALRDLGQNQYPVMGLLNGAFHPNDNVTRVSLAYSLVQSLALQDQARGVQRHRSRRSTMASASRSTTRRRFPPTLRGYVQLALDQGLINARFAVTQGPYDLQPTLHAYFDPNKLVTRAAYAVAAGRYLADYQSARGLIDLIARDDDGRPGQPGRFLSWVLRRRQQRIRIDRRALPPLLLRAQHEDREVQVRRIRTGIAGAADITDHVATLERLAFGQARR